MHCYFHSNPGVPGVITAESLKRELDKSVQSENDVELRTNTEKLKRFRRYLRNIKKLTIVDGELPVMFSVYIGDERKDVVKVGYGVYAMPYYVRSLYYDSSRYYNSCGEVVGDE